MPSKKSEGEHLQYIEFNRDSIFELSRLKEILVPGMDEVLDNLHAHILEEPVLNPPFCDKLGIDQISSACVTLSPC